jgi:hypothetical protein
MFPSFSSGGRNEWPHVIEIAVPRSFTTGDRQTCLINQPAGIYQKTGSEGV